MRICIQYGDESGAWWIMLVDEEGTIRDHLLRSSQEEATQEAMEMASRDPEIEQIDIYNEAGDWQHTFARISACRAK